MYELQMVFVGVVIILSWGSVWLKRRAQSKRFEC